MSASSPAADQTNKSVSACDGYEIHRCRQSREADKAFDSLRGPVKRDLVSHGLKPKSECEVVFDKSYQIEPFEDHEWHLNSGEPLPGDEEQVIISDPLVHREHAAAARFVISFVIPAMVSKLYKGIELGNAITAFMEDRHDGQSNRQIAKVHRAPYKTLNPMLQGLRELME